MSIHLTDDGTLDTVLRCDECGEEFRYDSDVFGGEYYDADHPHERIEQDSDGEYWRVRHTDGSLLSVGYATYQGAEIALAEMLRDEWIDECIAEAEAEHECIACVECGEPLTETERDNGETCERCQREQNEPQEGDITTSDHETFYQDGRAVFEVAETVDGSYMLLMSGFQVGGNVDRSGAGNATYSTIEAAVRAYMDRVQYWPNVWWMSDHGNAHRMDLK